MKTLPALDALRFALLALACSLAFGLTTTAAYGDESAGKRHVIEPKLVHLRDGAREWSSFPEKPDAARLEARFTATKNESEFTLRLRQQDVKQSWRVLLNDKPLGELVRDEADMVVYLPIAAGGLRDGENTVRIEPPARGAPDDIRVGELALVPRPVSDVLGEATLDVQVVDAETKRPIPARITLADANGSLHTTSAVSKEHLAARPGVVYTATGLARFGVPVGKYTLYAGRGFEYSLAQVEVSLAFGQTATQVLAIRREVPTAGYVACDTHIHTLTHSGHGDASLDERQITLAGEGIELPIATDHNVHIDYESSATRLGVRQFFTPVIGNEVTAGVGHFNIFPTRADARLPDHRHRRWDAIFDEIFATPDVRVAILNHARDVHGGTRPFGPKLFNSALGENVEGWPMRFNAMEIINSGATQSDVLRLPRDWMALQNRGYHVTPVGSSDSHDVSRYIVGQGRTYIRCNDRHVARLDTGAAIDSFLAGRVNVSYGLLAELTVDGKYHPGDLAALGEGEVQVDVRVLGPHWVSASRVQLYANGKRIHDEPIDAADKRLRLPGVKWQARWKLPRPRHDLHLVAIALGPGIDAPYWPTAKPYQPTSPDWTPQTIGMSGALWLDGDRDGRRSTPRDYAEVLFARSKGDLVQLVAALTPFDSATATQAAHLYRLAGGSLESNEFTAAAASDASNISDGFRAYLEAHRENVKAALEEGG